MNDDINKLYNALLNNGYKKDDLGGSEESFRESMGNAELRGQFYDWVAGREDFNIGSREAFERRMTAKPVNPVYGVIEQASGIPYPGKETDKSQYTFTGEQLNLEEESPKGYTQIGRDYKIDPIVAPQFKGEEILGQSTEEYMTDVQKNLDARKKDYNQLRQEQGIRAGRQDVVKDGDRYYTPGGSYDNYLKAGHEVDMAKEYNGVPMREIAEYYSLDENKRADYAKSVGRTPEEIEKAYESKEKGDINNQMSDLYRRIDAGIRGVNQKKSALQSQYEKERGFGGFIKDALMSGSEAELPVLQGQLPGSALEGSREWQNLDKQEKVLWASARQFNTAQKIINAAKSGDFITGMGDALQDLVLGGSAQDMQDLAAINEVSRKFEKGEKLTAKEEMLLESIAVNVAVASQYKEELSAWYNAGNMVGEMIPYMVEMWMNPLSKLGKKFGEKVLDRAKEKYGKDLAKHLVSTKIKTGAAKLGGAALGGYGMSLTTGLPSVITGVQKRTLGDAVIDKEMSGDIKYAGRRDAEGLGTAIYKETTKKMLDNASEMLGAGYLGKPFSWLQKAGKDTRLLGWLDNVANSKFGKSLNDFFEKTNWHGPLDEFMEEIHVGILEPMLVGDTSWGEFFTGKNLATIAIGVSVPGVAMATAATIQGAKDGAFKAGAKEKWKMERGELRGIEAWGPKWEEVKQKLDSNSLDDVDKVLTEIHNDKTLTPEQKVSAFEYGIYGLQYRTARGVADAFDTRKDMLSEMLRDAYAQAYSTEPTGEATIQASNNYQEAAKRVMDIFQLSEEQEIDDMLAKNSVETLANGDSQIADMLYDYKMRKAYFEGAQDRFLDTLEEQFTQSDKSIDKRTNKDNPTAVYSTVYDGEQVNITGGNVVLFENGKVDYENSSETLYVTFPDNTVKPVSAKNFTGVVTVENAEELKAAGRAEIDNRWRSEFDNAERVIDEGKKRKEGKLFNTSDELGEHTIEVLEEGETESRILLDGKEYPISTEELNQWRNEAGVVPEAEAQAVAPVVNEVAPIPMEKRGNVERAAYHLVPIERTMEDLHDGQLDQNEVQELINARIKEAYNDVQALEKKKPKEPKKPKMEGSKEAYLAAKVQAKEEFDKAQAQWQASMDEAKQRLDYYNELYTREQEITKSEIKEAYDNVQPREVIEMTADEFIANNLPKITPESFKAETGLSNSEQAEMVGYIAGADKGGVTVEQAAESIMENYGDELRSLGYSGDMQDVRDTIINILSQGNPRSYAKQGLAQRKQESIDQQRVEMESVAASLGFKSVEDMSAYEEQVIPGIIQMYTGFDYNEYYNNLAENYEYDTTRESETVGRGSELLQGEQPIDNAGTPVAEGNEGGAVSGSVQGNGTNAQTSGNEQVNEPVGNSEQLSSSEIPNNQSVAEGEDVSSVEKSNPLAKHAENIAKRLGVKVTLHTDASTVADRDAMTAIAEGGVIKGWYNPNTGEIALFLPNMESMRDVESTILHEAVSHYGIKNLLGKEEFNKFLDAVWEMMPASERAFYLEYVGADMKNPSQRNMRAAADEYVAHIAEKMDLSEVEKSIWDRILDFILARLKEVGFANLDRGDIENVIRASYRNLARNGGSSQVTGQGETMASKKVSERRQEKNRINNVLDEVGGIIYGNKEYAKKQRLKREAERKELAKDIYSSVLKGDFNDVILSQIDKFIEYATPANPFGRRISQRLPQRMERALRQGARTNAVDALFSRISESAVPANERFSEAGRREIEERKKELLKGWAIATGNWHTDLKEFTDDTEPIGEGKDSKVYSSKDGRYVIKASKGKPFGKRFRPDIDNIALFNDVFRDTRYEILGYGEIDGEFVRILQQPIVDFAESTPLTSEERREYMQSLGFEPLNDANTAFADGEIVIADLQKGNVVRDAAGNISVIDADAKLHTKDVGGDYTYPPVETDLPEGTDLSGTLFRKVGNTENNSIFASIYKTEDGKDINYTSERTEGYGVQDDGIGNSNSGSRRSILQRQTDTGVPGANSGLDVEKGEFCVVERVFTENGAFNFTSGEKIESADDVAYIFSALEDAAKEHSFVVYVKDGMPTVIELGMGSFNATMVDVPTASLAYSRINPDHVYFVHNHPSGNLICSSQDVAMLRVFEDMSDVPVTGVIINLKTGKYGTFDTERHSVIGEKRVPEKEERLAVHTLDKQIFAPDYDPMAQPLVRGSQDVAQFLNSQRMGDRPKVSFLILSRANRIIGNIHTPFTNITTDVEAVARYINERVIQFGGENVILYGDFAITPVEGMDFRLLQNAMDRFGKTKLLDVVRVEGNFTRSANDMGLLYEPEAEYKDGQTMFRRGDIPEAEQQRAKQQMLELIQPFAKEKREEEKLKDAERVINEFNRTHKGATKKVVVSRGKNSLVQQMRDAGFTDLSIEVAMRHYEGENDATDGAYYVSSDGIVIYDTENLDITLWHENTHRVIQIMFGGDLSEVQTVYKELPDYIKEDVSSKLNAKKYSEEDIAEEAVCFFVEEAYAGGLLQNGNDNIEGIFGEEESSIKDFAKFAQRLIDYINYGEGYKSEGVSERVSEELRESAIQERNSRSNKNGEGIDETAGGEEETRFRISEEYTDELISKMRENAELLLPRLLTEEVWKNEIEGKTFQSPVGPVKLGENQFDKNKGKGREKEFGMIIPTLERPDLIFEEFDPEEGAERQTKYVFAKAFYDSEGNKHVYYADVSVLKDGMEAVTSSHHLRPNQLRNKIKEEHLLWNRFASDSSSSAQGSSTDQNNAPSADKSSDNSLNTQEGETRFSREVEEVEADGSIDDVKTAPLTLMERITNSLLEVSAKNKENLGLRADALRAYGRDMENLLKLMRAQREYDKSTVDQLVKLAKMYFKNAQLVGEVDTYTMGRILSVINNVVGRKDISANAEKLMDILMNAHNKALGGVLAKAEKVKPKKINASGVEVIGSLDMYGQEMVESYNAGKLISGKQLDDAISDAYNNLADKDREVRKVFNLDEDAEVEKFADEYIPTGEDPKDATIEDYKKSRAAVQGYELAREYVDNIQSTVKEIADLEKELKDALMAKRKGEMSQEAYNEFRKSTMEAIFESKVGMIDAYHSLISKFSEGVRESGKRAKAFQQAQIDRVKAIQHNANSDMEGHPAKVQGKKPTRHNNAITRALMSPLGTFQTILEKFGEKAVDGKGYLYDRFMTQVTDAGHKEFEGIVAARATIEIKLKELFGKRFDTNKFCSRLREHCATVSYIEGGKEHRFELTRGQALYIYMANKMTDGQMKLRKMGITEEVVASLVKELPEKMVLFADWVQDDLMVTLRGKYNAVHERLFGVSMAAIENYFPLKIRKEGIGEKKELGQDAEAKPSTITGAIIKRTKNSAALDLSADAMQVLFEHIDQMEHWAAFAEFNRDINSLINYRHFQNQVKSMTTLRYGSGDVLWENFQDVVAIATETYKPKRSEFDKAVLNITKGITRSKINFRLYTALKQFLSAPAFWNNAGVKELAFAYANPAGSIKWAMENLPGFKERWMSRSMGNEKLLNEESDWKVFRTKFVENATKWGMTPNAAVDALTVAQGARAVYLTKLRQFKDAGYSEEQAEKKALQRAAESYNESQQSSEGAYLSAMQASGTAAAAIFTTFKNSNFGYTRKTAQAVANISRKMHAGYKKETIEFMKKKMMREGLTEEQAEKFATKIYYKSLYKDVADVALFGAGLGFLWNFGGMAIYLIAGDDDDEKEKILEEIAIRSSLDSLNGIPFGETAINAVMAAREGNMGNIRLPEFIAFGDVKNLAKVWDTDRVKFANDLINMLLAAGVGVEAKPLTDLLVAFGDMEDWSAEEFGLFALRTMSAPSSQLDRLLVDDAMENNAASLEEVAMRYIQYKKGKDTPITGWMYSDEGEQEAVERYGKRFAKYLDERLENVVEDNDTFDVFYNSSEPGVKKSLSSMRQKFLAGENADRYQKFSSRNLILDTLEVLKGNLETSVEDATYFEMTNSEDVDATYLMKSEMLKHEDVYKTWNKLKGTEKREYGRLHEKELEYYKDIKKKTDGISRYKSKMKESPENAERNMTKIREKQTQAIELINNYRNE